jgi:hypothetical protein
MDEDCKRKLAAVRAQYYTMIRVLEEDVLSSAMGTARDGMYTLASPTVRAVLSKDQMDEIESVKSRVCALQQAKGQAQDGPKVGEDTRSKRFNIRDVCKVPWRNIYVATGRVCGRDERTWIEISEPMLRSYALHVARGVR